MNTAAIFQALERWPERARASAFKAIFVALAYLLGAEIAFLIGTLSDKVFAPFWPPNIVLLCALVLAQPRDWWIYILAVAPAHIVAEHSVGMPTSQSLVAFATNCLVAIFNAITIRAFQREPPWFGSLRKALLYILATAIVIPALVALGGAFVPILGGGAIQEYWAFWLQWYLSNALSSLTLGPLALIVFSQKTTLAAFTTGKKLEGGALAFTLAIVCILGLRGGADHLFEVFIPTLALLPLALIVWSSIRFGAVGASVSILIVTIIAIGQTLNGPSLFIAASVETTMLGLQLFLIVLAVPVLLLGAAAEEARKATQEAKTNQDLMTLSAMAADSCLWQYDRSTGRFWMTENGRGMFGLDAQDPLTRVLIEKSVHPDDRQATINAVRSASLRDAMVDIEFRLLLPGGKTRWIRARGRVLKNMHGNPKILSGTFADITERKAAEHEADLRQAEIAHLMRVSMLGELSGGIAHELTQPLTAILSNAQAARIIMDNQHPNLAEIAEALDDIISDDNRAGEVIHRMRSLLKGGEAKFETIDLNELIRSTLQLLRSEFVNRRVKATNAFEDKLPLVYGDRIQLQQVLLNLAMNAVDAMHEQITSRRIIAIQTRLLSEQEIEVSVADQGGGLSPTQQERIFQPFFSTKERGLGLGLSICASIVKSHGGKLNLVNNPAGGAVATFTLPRHS